MAVEGLEPILKSFRSGNSRRNFSARDAIGLAVLYCSSYFLPLVRPSGAYFVAIGDVAYPTLLAIIVIAPALFLAGRYLLARSDTRRSQIAIWLVLTAFSFVAITSAFAAADLIPSEFILLAAGSQLPRSSLRILRVLLAALTVGGAGLAMWWLRFRWPAVVRFFGLLGCAFLVLAILRLVQYTVRLPAAAATPGARETAGANAPASRRVVWIIFDELDYGEVFGTAIAKNVVAMPNLTGLRNRAVSAEQAFPPARDTRESVPALLTGLEVRGAEYDGRGQLILLTAHSGARPFVEPDSIFTRLPQGTTSAAILGYFHPYCRVFPSVRDCEAISTQNAGRWFDALAPFGESALGMARWTPVIQDYLPDGALHSFVPMYRASEELVRQLPRYVSMVDKALVFIHMNLPHVPSEYSQRVLGLPPVADDLAGYRQNLLLVDRIVGQVVQQMRAGARRTDALLIVSADHWYRPFSQTKSLRVPFIVWHVGEEQGVRMPQQLTTLHTGALIADFLSGHVSTQSEIAKWWDDKPAYATWIPERPQY